MTISLETRQHIKAEVDKAVRSRPSTFTGVCLHCLEEIPPERYRGGGAPKYCSDSHRKKFLRRK